MDFFFLKPLSLPDFHCFQSFYAGGEVACLLLEVSGE
jgi:hypothetical protein